MNGTPFPSSAPMSSVDAQQLALINGIHNHVFSASQMFIMTIVMFSPLPMSWKLAVFNFLSSSPIAHLSPTVFLFIIAAGPILSLLFLYFATKLLISLTKTVFPIALARLRKESREKAFLELTFPADTEKSAYATEQLYTLLHTLARRKTGLLGGLIGEKRQYSLEIVGTKNEGIRYILAADPKDLDILKRSLMSYLPGIKIKEVEDYFALGEDQSFGIVELKLSSHFALPLAKQNALSVHDPIAYLTGHMTGLAKDEFVAFQVVATPVLSSIHSKLTNEMKILKHKMYRSEPLAPVLQKSTLEQLSKAPVISALILLLKGVGNVFSFFLMLAASFPAAIVDSSGKSVPIFQPTTVKVNVQEILNPYEQELRTVVKEKIDQHLFEATIRILVAGRDEEELEGRMQGLISSFGPMESPYQSLATKTAHGKSPVNKRLDQFITRSLATSTMFNQNPVLSTNEISDIFHFPYTDTTKTEDIVKTLSPDLPAPLSLKKGRNLDVIFARNTYGSRTVDIGLTDEERARHVYLLGRTGSGKSTIIYHMAKEDIQKGRGVCVIDPHGDLAEALLEIIPQSRINDLVYFNPYDLKYPVRINLLELPEGLDDDELELEKELVAESVISVFRRIFSKEEYVNAHRIEYILRNTIYTSFAVPDRTLFTIYKLLTNKDYRKKIVATLDDENLKDFWNNEFGQASNWQVVKMISGVTAKIGRFLYSPTTKRIFQEPKSTINFDEMLAEGKILICNLSEGKIGEDTMQVLGLTIIAKIHQAALRRSRQDSEERNPYYLFVDEFQNFATTSFTRILSGGRKFGLRLTLAEQSSAQQSDRQVINVILANTGTVICFATASPQDEQMMESQFAPHITRYNLTNLPKYHFYIKMSATEPEEPFSGETLPIDARKDPKKLGKLIEASRKNYASLYVKPKKAEIKEVKLESTANETKSTKGPKGKGGLPKLKRR